MLFKLDENMPEAAAQLMRDHGHDAVTIRDQCMVGHPDESVRLVCKIEERIVVTFDLGFVDSRKTDLSGTPGVIVFRLKRQSLPRLLATLEALLPRLEEELPGNIWIVDEARVRIRPIGGGPHAPQN
jgi:predicted nuclease of predicted toxin-antitoxin system